jgi:hypothetical protein
VQEWTSAHSSAVLTLTEFNGHLYSGGHGSNKIQKWNVGIIEPLSLPPRLTRNRKMELLNQQSELEEAVVKCLEEIEQQETKKETEYVQRGVQNEGRHLQEMQRLQQNFQEGMQRREQEIQRREREIQRMHEEMEAFQQTYQTNKTRKEQAYQTNKTRLQQTHQTNKAKIQKRHEKLLEQQTIVQANIDMLENGQRPTAPPLPTTSSSSSNPQSSEPEEFLCPITGDIMKDPVSDNQGISYERKEIEEWLKRGNTTSPVSRQPLQLSDLRPNIALRKLIEDWQSKHL